MVNNKKNIGIGLNSCENTITKLNDKELKEIIGGKNFIEWAAYGAAYLSGMYAKVLETAYANGYNGVR